MEKLIWSIYKGLSEKGEFDLYICSLTNHGENFMVNEFKSVPSEVLILNASNKNFKARDYFTLLKTVFILSRYIARNKIDVVHSHDFFSAMVTRVSVLISVILWWHKPRKNLVTLHNLFFWLKRPHRIINRFLSFFTDKIICVSKSVFEHSFHNDRIKKGKYSVIYNAIDGEVFKPDASMNVKYREIFNFKPCDFIIGNVGAFSFRKGHKYLVKAFSLLSNDFPDAYLVIFGSPMGHEDEIFYEIEMLIKENHLEERVKIISPRKDIKHIYNMFDVFSMSSVTEGLSLAALEAMLTQRVCIYSDIGPFREIIKDGINGFLFKSEDYKDLESKLRYVIKNYPSLENVKKQARESVLNDFNYTSMINNYYNLYKI